MVCENCVCFSGVHVQFEGFEENERKTQSYRVAIDISMVRVCVCHWGKIKQILMSVWWEMNWFD